MLLRNRITREPRSTRRYSSVLSTTNNARSDDDTIPISVINSDNMSCISECWRAFKTDHLCALNFDQVL